MKTNHLLFIHPNLTSCTANMVVINIPWGDIDPLVFENRNAWKTFRPLIQVFLIAKFISVQLIVAPLNASLPPPLQAADPNLIISERDDTNIIQTINFTVAEIRMKPMTHNTNRLSS